MRRPTRARLIVAALAALAACTTTSPEAQLLSRPPTVPTTVPPTVATTTTTLPAVAPAVEELIVGAGMTAEGRRLFVNALPQLDDSATLSQSCGADVTGGPGTTHTLGCVIRGRIHVKSLSTPAAHDLMYVVAAHELLHVAWARLPATERSRLEAELQAARVGNSALEERLEVYTSAAEDTPNELHSVLGTEFAGLSAALETHFSRYFDRGTVVGAFRRTLGDREDGLRELRARIDSLEAQITDIRARMDAQEAAGDLRGYNANVPVHNSLVRQVNAAISEHNQLLAEYRSLFNG